MPEYHEPNDSSIPNLFSNLNNLTQHSGNVQLDSEQSYCQHFFAATTGIQNPRSYSGLDGALTMNSQANPAPPNIGSTASDPAHNDLETFYPFDANPYHDFQQLYNANSSLGSVSIETYSSSLNGALG